MVYVAGIIFPPAVGAILMSVNTVIAAIQETEAVGQNHYNPAVSGDF